MIKTTQPVLTLDNILRFSTYSLALMPMVSYGVNSVCMIAWAALLLIYNGVNYKNQSTSPAGRHKKLFWLYSGNFLFFVLSLLYTTNLQNGLSFLQTAVPMMVFPLGFFLIPRTISVNPQEIRKILLVFWASTLILSLFILYKFVDLGYFGESLVKSSLNVPFRERIEDWTDKHPIYISVYLAFSFFIAISQLKRNKHLANLLFILSIGLFFFLLLLLASRAPLAGLVVGIIFVIFFRIKTIKIKLILILGFLGAFTLFVRFSPAIYSRVQEFQQTALQPPVGQHHNSVNIRVGIWSCAWQIIRDNFWLGVGAGDEKHALTNCYAGYSTDVYQIRYYNTHNQYLNIWMLTGIFSLLFFVSGIGYAFAIAMKQRNYMLLFFLVLCCVSFATENVLNRQAGVVFYSFFLCLLVYASLNRKPIENSEFVKKTLYNGKGK